MLDDLREFLETKKQEGEELAKAAKGSHDIIRGYMQCIDEVLEYIDMLED